ncbi:MAG: magnesium transporter CorA family protein [Gammaproteobacteria bacterium]|uniref:magnesium transporter CorA family protein n=1 Tax=Rhodoferax sp. TaxID=50421 RepID=UPI0018316E1A|nr:magnesium transporter CorA family protein [Rhodoferax sp.]MBU3900697.1 magnesium transporter CorA family protein [Gammaproteobacteria bacterium]MBA3059670.1 magnesium transporter CorA family protein [Rhodoferax sp.]MBU3998377.1 magnesium transporter CorA family protein [Gammaproteobacteria bacterium]MBU4081355.1 magnesium transporter CorA family protein [Gammaproteobacteria bacterium]MBU4112332.1 magnesium transporter CorA family protein [Gammaproteobacteria bacterium]
MEQPLRIFTIDAANVRETLIAGANAALGLTPLAALQQVRLPERGYLWIACSRAQFEALQAQLHATLQALTGTQLLDLHVADLLNQQLPSRYDVTSQYDLLVFRRLEAGRSETDQVAAGQALAYLPARGGPPILRRIDTSPVGFVVFDRVLLTIHPTDFSVRDAYAARLLAAGGSMAPAASSISPDSRSVGARGVPSDPADMMLRIVNQMVDSYLDLRRDLTHQLDHWQAELLNPKTRFNNWSALLSARLSLHHLDEICEDQRSAVQDWIESLKTWPEADTALSQRAHEMLLVRSRDVLEHIERVVHHVRRLEQNAEAAVQMHFNAQSHRTNEIMRTLTVLTAIFLPLNLIAGIFGMNFDFIPLLHRSNGFWLAMVAMGFTTVLLVVFFWRKRYLERSPR